MVIQPPQQPGIPQEVPAQAITSGAIAGFPSYPQAVMCPTCRRMGPPGKFCQDCGAKLPMPDLFCPQCSAQLNNNPPFCPECCTKMQQAISSDFPPRQPSHTTTSLPS